MGRRNVRRKTPPRLPRAIYLTMTALSTVGHSNHTLDAFLGMIQAHGIARVVDVRAFPRSRRHPHFNRAALADALADAGHGYTWAGDVLGGFRKARPDSRHTALSEPGLRGFADYMETEAFAQALARLVALAGQDRVAIMCAEADYRHCHRQLIADALSLAGVEVTHLHASRPAQAHTLSATLGDGRDPPVYNRHAQGDLFD